MVSIQGNRCIFTCWCIVIISAFSLLPFFTFDSILLFVFIVLIAFIITVIFLREDIKQIIQENRQKYIICPRCKILVKKNEKFCPKCGKSI